MHPEPHTTHHRNGPALTATAIIAVLIGAVLTIAAWGTLFSVAGVAVGLLGLLTALVGLMMVRSASR
ncbi:hypothetical protein [Curtobacterium sp. 24E2]|nr:hypothetical protein JN350_16800 [Curtobacterium sp. 24E2]